jgi:hypothetical protein
LALCGLAGTTFLTACAAHASQGRIVRICGTVISQAEVVAGTWYVDMSRGHDQDVTAGSVDLTATYAPMTWARVSRDCAHGADVALVPSTAGSVVETITAADGKPEAVRVRLHPDERSVKLEIRLDGTLLRTMTLART